MSLKTYKRRARNFFLGIPEIDPKKIQNKIVGDPNSLKLVGFVKCFNEGHNGNLERCLKHLSAICDDIVICDDSSTDNSVEIAKKFTNQIIHLPDDFNAELEHKQILLEHALTLDPDWIVWLDPDETFDNIGESGGIRTLCQFGNENKLESFSFRWYNLYNNINNYRTDGLWIKNWQPKIWKNTGKLKFEVKRGLHHDNTPVGVSNHIPINSRTKIKLIHYGLISAETRKLKYKNYLNHGMSKGGIVEFIKNDNGLHTKKFLKDWFPLSTKK